MSINEQKRQALEAVRKADPMLEQFIRDAAKKFGPFQSTAIAVKGQLFVFKEEEK